jgi:hypothetical protein
MTGVSEPACFAGMVTAKQAMQRLTDNSSLGRLAGTRLVSRRLATGEGRLGSVEWALTCRRNRWSGSSSMARWYAYDQDRKATAMSLLMVIGVGADGQKSSGQSRDGKRGVQAHGAR